MYLNMIFPEVKSWKRLISKMVQLNKLNSTTSAFCKLLFIYILVLNFVCKYSLATILGDSCDWTGSGLESEIENGRPGVTPIYLRCQSGQVTWVYPRGALRILLRLPTTGSSTSSNSEFKVCIKVRSDKNVARVFLEGQRSLHQLHFAGDNSNQMRCFQSKNGQSALYVESLDWKGLTKRSVEIEYDLQQLPDGVTRYDPYEECRPCSSEEMVHAFCTSDLVTRGIIKTVDNSNDLETAQLNVRVTKLIRHIPNTISGSHETDLNDSRSIVTHTSGRTARSVNILVGAQCGVSHGGGEFVFMARRRLGDFTIKCAPRLEDWMDTVRAMKEQGHDHCVLNS